ncbi:MAG: hypothetical protein KGI11_09940 [Thaumarchaeota archaeon]|nr:hypothetical protein [Nitrososphaerota archaeon]
MKVGTKEIPEYRLSSSLLSDLKILFEKNGRQEIELPTAAEILGHKSPKSGTFLYKIAAFRAYGLADGRGKIAVTDIGENIVFKKDEMSYNNAFVKALTKIPLWSILFDKYTKMGKEIRDDDFWLELKNQCELTIEQAKNLAPEILKAYREDSRLINMSLLMEKREPQQPFPNEPTKPSGGNSQNDDNMLVISYGKYNVTLPKEYSEREEVGEILKSMIDLSLKQKKSSKEPITEETIQTE